MANDVLKLFRLRKLCLEYRGIIAKISIKIYSKFIESKNCYIPLSANITDTICFPHGLSGIFISDGATIGNGCTIFQQVTIGSNTLEGTKHPGAPVIGNNVYIGAGAKIIGGITVGDNVRIGANAVVTSNIPDNSTVVLEKPRIILHENNRNNNHTMYSNFIKK